MLRIPESAMTRKVVMTFTNPKHFILLWIMATVNYYVSGKKRESVPVYVRFLSGREKDFMVKSGLRVNPAQWSNKTQSLKQRIRTKADGAFLSKLSGLRDHLNNELRTYTGEYSKNWLETVINSYHYKGADSVTTMTGFIESFLTKAEAGAEKDKQAVNFAPATLRSLRGFQRIFNMYQGIYTE